ncbi:glycosyl hydrolase family 61-domain-containing protein [Phialemonium atrogriseum]|uniref:lytic cellulose monooxygenase (C4-dehydrogenating) n=1 Tax=Phialemonium atrogriseum TaxID=1093897 RepID=A0AAJ0FIL1_9PEZI|nr:glycosyl hydrolase family 61-domain-containing protein [Phialemonium atrogriseum]KAK1764488.1 glycosyl hydrolase family 61-domain-containing protein [Phialemonium atrogriseum]
MGNYKSAARAAAVALASAATVAAHGHITNIVINGVSYLGYDSPAYSYSPNPPPTIGWIIDQTDNGFVSPDKFGHPDIICHRSAKPAPGHATVAAGDKISLQWLNPWPDSHHGPVIDYLARCDGLCEEVDKTKLEFFKIDGPGWVSGANPGLWAADTLIQNNSTWLVQIPANLAAGNYVLRHEIIALHAAGSVNGAQAYPQCINIQVTGGGTNKPSGVVGTKLYKSNDPGILFNLYTSPVNYIVPGPTLIAGVPISVAQSSSRITASASPTLGNSGGGGATTTPTTSKGPTSTPPITTLTTTTKPTTTAKPTTTPPPAGGPAQTRYGQCGGSGWTGPSACAQGSSCSVLNDYYYQCL